MPDGGMSPEPLEIARRESRAVLDQQIETGRLHTTAASQCALTAAGVTGILLAGAGIVGAQRLVHVSQVALGLFVGGAILLLSCQYFGFNRTQEPEPTYGIRASHRESAVQRDLRSDYLKELLDDYDDWTAEMIDHNAKLERRLFISQMCLTGGLIAVTLGGGVVVVGMM